LTLYEDRASGTITPGPNVPEGRLGDGGYFKKHEIVARFLQREKLAGVPQSVPDSLHEVENPTEPIADVIEKIAEIEADALDCGARYKKKNGRL
jgi:hypothetical protein